MPRTTPLDPQTIAAIHPIAARCKATSVRVYGSRARGDHRPDSDLDLLVDFEPTATLLDRIGIEQGLSHRIRTRVLRDAVSI